jgi:hypothetical protein
MKKGVMFMLFVVACYSSMLAQTDEVVRIKAGQNPETAFSPNGFYRYPSFNEGTVYMKNGDQTIVRMNYHMLNEEMQFISTNGDTFALADPFSLKFIVLDSGMYYYSDGYLEVIHNHDVLKLARKLRLNVRTEKIGAYGQASPSGSIRTPNRLILGNMGKDLTINQDLLIQKDYSYYWVDKYTTVLKATKANLLKLLPADKKLSIDEYLKNNKIDFNKEADLKKLLQYSLSL